MITAHLYNDYLVLPESFEWDLIRYSQLLSFDKLVDCVVPAINFPDDENGHNRAVLNQPNRFTLVRKTMKKYAGFELRSNGYCMIRGTLLLKEGFNGSVYGVAGKLSELNQDKLISDYNLPEVTFENKADYSPDADDYACATIKNQQFFQGIGNSETYTDADENEVEETILQLKHKNIGYRVNEQGVNGVSINNENLTFTLTSAENYRLTVVSPFLFLFSTVEKLLKENGIYLRSNEIATDAELMKLLIYNNVDINKTGIGSTYVKLGKETKNGSIWAIWAGYITALTRSISTFQYSKMLSKTSIKDYILGIQNLLNIAFVFNNDDTYAIVDREAALLGPSTDIDKFMSGSWELGEKKDVSLKFTQIHDDNDALFSDSYVDLSDRLADFGEDVLMESVLPYIEGSKIGELRRVLPTQRIYEWTMTTTTNRYGIEIPAFAWTFISSNYQPGWVNYAAEKEVEEITTCFSTLCGDDTSENPKTEQSGQSELRKSTEAPFTPRLLFYTGDLTCNNQTNNYSLKFTGANNMIDTRWKNFAPWWAKRQAVTGYAKFTDSFFKNFNINKKVSNREGEVMPLQTTTRITNSGLQQTKIEGFKVE